MHRADDARGAQRRATVEHAFHEIDGLGADRRIGDQGIDVGAGQRRNRGPLQAHIREPAAERLELRGLAAEHRHLDAVIAGLLQVLEDRHVPILDTDGPEQKIETDLHGGTRSPRVVRLLILFSKHQITKHCKHAAAAAISQSQQFCLVI